MQRASIDLGTNTCLLLLVEWDSQVQRIRQVISDHSNIVRLGQGVDQNRRLHPDAMRRTLDCLRKYAQLMRQAGINPTDPQQAVCVATSQARDASNGPEFFSQIKKETGLNFRVLSGDEEALYTFKGALLSDMDEAQTAVIDIGGGSTEFMSKDGGKSLDIGSVRFTERFLKSDPVTDEQFWACQAAIDAPLTQMRPWREQLKKRAPEATLLAVAGTATTLASIHLGIPEFDRKKIDQTTLTRGDLHRMVEELKWRTIEERRQLAGIEPQRADVLLAGALILWRACEVLDFKQVRISTQGLRYGVLHLGT